MKKNDARITDLINRYFKLPMDQKELVRGILERSINIAELSAKIKEADNGDNC